MIKRAWAALTAGLLFLLTACGDGLQTERLGGVHGSDGDLYPESVVSLDGKAVSFDEFRYYYLNFRDQYLAESESAFSKEGAEEQLKEEVLDSLLTNRATVLLAEEEGVSLSSADEKEVKQEIRDAVALYGKDGLVESLHTYYMSQQMYRESVRFTKLYQKLFDAYYGAEGSETLSDEEFLSYYKENYLAVQVIYLPYERGEDAEECPATLTRAEDILTKYEAGEDFWALVEEYGEDPGMELEPDGYYITQGEAEDVLYRASAALAEGEVSQAVKAAAGVYLIRRVEIKDEKALKRKADVLEGYEDGAGNTHSGVYNELFLAKLQEKSKSISVQYDPVWSEINSESVY